MRLRTRQLASLLLLLTALGAAGQVAAPAPRTRTYLQALFARGAASAAAFATSVAPTTPEPRHPGHPTATALPSAARDLFPANPASYPPAAQAAAVFAATSFARG